MLIYAASPGHDLGEPVWELIEEQPEDLFGSAFLLPELLIKPVAANAGSEEVHALTAVLARLQLVNLTASVAALSVELGSAYALKPADAVHLASAIWVGADNFVTNNGRDFKRDRISEVNVLGPQEL